jgi:hypothetical protein
MVSPLSRKRLIVKKPQHRARCAPKTVVFDICDFDIGRRVTTV